MLLSDAPETSRSWSSGINRIGLGAISTVAAANAFGLLDKLTTQMLPVEANGAIGLISLVGFFLAANLLGTVSVTFGGPTLRSQMPRKRLIAVCTRVSQLKDDLCNQTLSDANLKFDLVAGARGAFLISVSFVVLAWLDSPPAATSTQFEVKVGALAFGIFVYAGIMVLLDEAAVSTYAFLEELMDSLECARAMDVVVGELNAGGVSIATASPQHLMGSE